MSETQLSALHWYALDPIDVLLFRESKPFSPGEGSWAKGLFPPMPTTIFQALRSALPYTPSQTRDLRFLGPFLLDQENTLWLPTPKDLLAIKHTDPGADPDTTPEDNFEEKTQGDQYSRLQPIEGDHWKYIRWDDQKLPPLVTPFLKDGEYIKGRPQPWIRASALSAYLEGQLPQSADFQEDPWDTQVLPHIDIKSDTRQVKEDAGYFTEVAIRLRRGWRLAAAISTRIPTTTVRLGGEGHRALVAPLEGWDPGIKLDPLRERTGSVAYLLTPGLAQAEEAPVYQAYPSQWQPYLVGCATDRALLWGGISAIRRRQQGSDQSEKADFALLPQRAFIPAGTVYRFKQDPPPTKQLLGKPCAQSETFESLNYGTLLWGS
ncbi:MAG: type III-B CRISPR module-associated Cmr3 family protein [Cyanobacteriota bacterium]|nr:type III-B CRISPR module-associated Cmr3 family protein [Cyanobacteriota bacterium]